MKYTPLTLYAYIDGQNEFESLLGLNLIVVVNSIRPRVSSMDLNLFMLGYLGA